MRMEISMNNARPTVSTINLIESSQSSLSDIPLTSPAVSSVEAESEYISLYSNQSNISAAKYWVIKKGLTAATGLGIAVWGVVGFGGVLSLLLNSKYDACVNIAAGMIAVGVSLSILSAILYTKAITYCRKQELVVSHLARRLAMGEGGAPALVLLNHLERPMHVMAPLDIIARARDRGGSYVNGVPVLQFSRGMTLKYGCIGRDGKNATVYLPDPNSPIDRYPKLRISVIASVACFYVGITIVTTFLIVWVSAYPNDDKTMLVSTIMDILGGVLAIIAMGLGAFVYSLCLKYELQDESDCGNPTYTNPIMTIS
ncbi:hypothetical protein SK128_027216 [Halocaridina rubra]|uniref:Transmembrane protein n=1 Tax=Halocaridina rubra TaxID=373956 RepID=A0AAN8XR18_HALRR